MSTAEVAAPVAAGKGPKKPAQPKKDKDAAAAPAVPAGGDSAPKAPKAKGAPKGDAATPASGSAPAAPAGEAKKGGYAKAAAPAPGAPATAPAGKGKDKDAAANGSPTDPSDPAGAAGGEKPRKSLPELPKELRDKKEAALKPLRQKVEEANKKLLKLEAEIEAVRKQQASFLEKRNTERELVKDTQTKLNAAFERKKVLNHQFEQLKERANKLRDQIYVRPEGRQLEKAESPSAFVTKNLATLDKEIKTLEHKHMTSTQSKQEEQKLTAQISDLKKVRILLQSAPIKEYEAAEAAFSAAKTELKTLNDTITTLKAEREKVLGPAPPKEGAASAAKGAPAEAAAPAAKGAKKVDKTEKAAAPAAPASAPAEEKKPEGEKPKRDNVPDFRPRLDELRKQFIAEEDAYNAAVDAHNEKVKALKKEEREYFQKLREKKDKEYQEMRERRAAQFAERKARDEAWQAEQAKLPPYEQELATCNSLLKYLRPLLQTATDAAAAPAAPAAPTSAELKAAEALKRGEKPEEDFPRKKKAAANKPAAAAPRKAETLSHNFKYIAAFEKLSMSIPTKREELAGVITAIETKKTYFEEQQTVWEKEQKAKEAADKEGAENGAKEPKSASPKPPSPNPAAASAAPAAATPAAEEKSAEEKPDEPAAPAADE